MKNHSLDSQLKALYEKAQSKRQQTSASVVSPEDSIPGELNDHLKSSIERMQEISQQADSALQELAHTADVKAQLAQVGKIHQRIMQEQHHLETLYQKIKLPPQDS